MACGLLAGFRFCKYVECKLWVPEHDDDAVEDVKAAADVGAEPLGHHLEHHLQAEDGREQHVAQLHGQGQLGRLQHAHKHIHSLTHTYSHTE